MHPTRRFIFYVLLGCFFFSAPLRAQEGECYSKARGCGIRPSWALTSLIAVVVLAIALQRNESFHAHIPSAPSESLAAAPVLALVLALVLAPALVYRRDHLQVFMLKCGGHAIDFCFLDFQLHCLFTPRSCCYADFLGNFLGSYQVNSKIVCYIHR